MLNYTLFIVQKNRSSTGLSDQHNLGQGQRYEMMPGPHAQRIKDSIAFGLWGVEYIVALALSSETRAAQRGHAYNRHNSYAFRFWSVRLFS